MTDPRLEAVKAEVCDELGVPLEYFQSFLDLEEEKVHFARRHGLLEDLRQLTVHAARRDLPEVPG